MIAHGKDIKVFTGNSNPKLAQNICQELGIPLGDSEVGAFSDGENFASIYETVRGSDVFVVQSTCPFEKDGVAHTVNDALMELRNILIADGLHPIAAGAFVGEHSFSRVLGQGRPNAEDTAQMDRFAAQTAELPAKLEVAPQNPVAVGGQESIRPYYTPRDRAGNPINILKVKPKTDLSRCGGCGLCADLCPMGSIDPADVSAVRGICIKCCACVKGCPTGAKFFDDAGYLYHQHELEAQYARPAENEVFYL